MSEAPKKLVLPEAVAWTFSDYEEAINPVKYIRADIVDELVEALKFAWPIIEHERYKWDGSYGKNFDSAKADRARQASEKSRAALAKLEESHD